MPEPTSKWKNFVSEMFLWTLLAFFGEVIITATVERLSLWMCAHGVFFDRTNPPRAYLLHDVRWYSLQGHTTIWDFVDGVGMTAGLRLVVRAFQKPILHGWFARGLFVMFLIYVLEFFGGLFFNKLLGMNLWDYSQYQFHGIPLHLMGQITIVYAPFWFLAGFFVPPVYKVVHHLAPYLEEDVEKVIKERFHPKAA